MWKGKGGPPRDGHDKSLDGITGPDASRATCSPSIVLLTPTTLYQISAPRIAYFSSVAGEPEDDAFFCVTPLPLRGTWDKCKTLHEANQLVPYFDIEDTPSLHDYIDCKIQLYNETGEHDEDGELREIKLRSNPQLARSIFLKRAQIGSRCPT
ncbi:uncharacterized protein F4807DRAFT_464309 [Annulohypoxylon truncatum]|uniref:uncharacterized protein n=1 Tax=Annulohypoxylon truncatum TaxID=327061 RepID=UPI002007B23A|nr:uncharacterized protein F4807DRAFT_464309 [Annulohypoxylon truncatum]KAI1205847.1 hypothetical protein F4807DRAFT_464309 [Annulohypoxylon truncatum]